MAIRLCPALLSKLRVNFEQTGFAHAISCAVFPCLRPFSNRPTAGKMVVAFWPPDFTNHPEDLVLMAGEFDRLTPI